MYKKIKVSDIIKPGTKLIARKLDPNDPEIQKAFDNLKEEQRKCLERKNINWNELDQIYITI